VRLLLTWVVFILPLWACKATVLLASSLLRFSVFG
jgi:hypothetical protein